MLMNRILRGAFQSSRKQVVLSVVLALGIALGTASTAAAHGPTVKLSHDEMTPSLLNLYVGTTVHFTNTVSMPGGHIVMDEAGTLESPALLSPGDGWHYTFEAIGTYEIFIKEHPKAKMRIVIVEKN